MRYAVMLVVGVSVAALGSCKKHEKHAEDLERESKQVRPESSNAPGATAQPPGARASTVPQRSEGGKQPSANPDSVVQRTLVGLKDVTWVDAPPALPKGAKVAVLEGTPPFSDAKSFTILAKMPKDYKIMPHTHLVTERITVLEGELWFGHGAVFDAKAATKVTPGGLVLIPAGHVHYAFTGGKETTIALTGIGPWDIIYVDPKDDPRPTPARKPANLKPSKWDAPIVAQILQAKDIKFSDPPPGMVPQGVKLAVLEGDPMQSQWTTIRFAIPKGVKLLPHASNHTVRAIFVSGTTKLGFGDTWDDKALREAKAPSLAIVPANESNYGIAESGNVIVQMSGVGPIDMTGASDDETQSPDALDR